ncbi:MAG: hypothetical protein IT426_18495 [Pirellulales bacterium]|nr:hypothetical protein [Pirellulales bacterium]
MKFQFSIVRLLMATAMFALIFGLARLALEEELAVNAIYIFALAVYWGLIVLVARKRSDLYRILRIFVLAMCIPAFLASLVLIHDSPTSFPAWGFVWLASGVAMIWLILLFNRLIAKAKKKE